MNDFIRRERHLAEVDHPPRPSAAHEQPAASPTRFAATVRLCAGRRWCGVALLRLRLRLRPRGGQRLPSG